MLEIDKTLIELLKKGVTFSKLKTKTGLYASDLTQRLRFLEDRGYLIERLFREHGVKLQLTDKPLVSLQC